MRRILSRWWQRVLFPCLVYRLSTDTRNKVCDACVDDIDAGAGAGHCYIRTTAQPTAVDDADTGVTLADCVFGDPAFDDAGSAGGNAAGVATANAITSEDSALASGTAAHFRIKDSSGNIHSDGTCGQGSGDMSFDNNVIVLGGIVNISAMTVTAPVSA